VVFKSDPRGLSLAHLYPGGKLMSLPGASAAVNLPVPQANVPFARPGELSRVWVVRSTRQVALVYGAGNVTVMMAPALYGDPKAEFTRFLHENHAKAALGSVNGSVALVIAPRSDATRSNPAWVEFDNHGVDVNVVSATHGPAILMAVARSLAADGGRN
jgi:hypothetical protein